MAISISSASATKSICIINIKIHLSDGYNFGLTRELLIFLVLQKETIALGNKYRFLCHKYVKYQDVP